MGVFLRTLCVAFSIAALAPAAPAAAERITFEEALRRVMDHNHGLRASRLAAESAREAALQARALPNPRAEARIEDLGREEIEIGFSQTIELGGKRAARVDIATAGAREAELSRDAGSIELEAESLRRFAALLAAARRVDLVEATIELAGAALAEIERRIAAGAARETDLIQGRIALEELRMERGILSRGVETAALALTALWGAPSAAPLDAAGEFAGRIALPPADSMRALALAHPAAARYGAHRAHAAAELARARSDRFPDIEIGAGVIRRGGTGDAALALGASIPLPLFDRNAAAVRERERLAAAADGEIREALVRREAEILAACAAFDGAGGALGSLDAEIVPRAEAAFGRIKEYYAAGAASFLELNESRRDLVRLRLRRIDLLAERASAASDIMALTGYRPDVFVAE
jgi:cobalt-zinc-cadmium efflux system outer membrane protein